MNSPTGYQAFGHALRAIVLGLVLVACSGGPGSEFADPVPDPIPTNAPQPEAISGPGERAEPIEVASSGVTVLGSEEIMFDWSGDRCDDAMRPDLPVRAFRRADGTIAMTLADPFNHLLVGDSFDTLAPQCPAIRSSIFDPDPEQYAHFEWLAATYTDDGETIHGIVHNEFHGNEAGVADWRSDALANNTDAWSAFGRTADGPVEMDATDDGWGVADTLCSVAFWGLHPDVGCDAVLRWTAPATGEYHVVLYTNDAATDGGDGVLIELQHNASQLWTAQIDAGDPADYGTELEVAMADGDTLDVIVQARGDSSFDATSVSLTIDQGDPKCLGGVPINCHQMSLTYAVSTDGGQSWSSPDAPDHVVAAIPEIYQPDAGFVAMWQPSNIVRNPNDGYLYMTVQYDYHRNGVDLQGTCLLRTETINDPSSWRAWDGIDFVLTMPDPYTTAIDPLTNNTCASVVEAPISGLVYSTELDLFVATASYGHIGESGIFMRTSPDLVNWSDPVRIVDAEFVWTGDGIAPYDAYPTLIDPTSESMNFDTIGAEPYLYFSRFNSTDPRDYDLIRVPIQISEPS